MTQEEIAFKKWCNEKIGTSTNDMPELTFHRLSSCWAAACEWQKEGDAKKAQEWLPKFDVHKHWSQDQLDGMNITCMGIAEAIRTQ